jgi:hypothetical protein
MCDSRALAYRRHLTVLAALALLVGCEVATSTDPSKDPGLLPGVNTPAVGVTPTGFGFAVQARDFTYDQTYGPTVQQATIGVGISVANYTHGMALIEVRDAAGTLVFAQRISGNVAQGNTTASGTAPFTIHVAFDRFSGLVAIGVGPGGE